MDFSVENTNTVILSRVNPPAMVETVLFQVPVSSRAFVEGITVCNRSSNAQSLRISISAQGLPTALKDFVYFDLPIRANDTLLVELDFTMNASDVIRIFASSVDLSFILYGYLV